MEKRIIWTLILVLFTLASWGHGRPEGSSGGEPQSRQSESTKPSVDRSSYFDVELLAVMTRHQQDGNVVISPLSVKLVLAMLMEGASGNSRDEIRRALRLPGDLGKARDIAHSWVSTLQETPENITLSLATQMFISNGYSINGDFGKTLATNYGGNVTSLDVGDSKGAADTVNTWVHNVTHGLIPLLVSEGDIGPDTRALLASAVYFKGSWNQSFDSMTLTRCFYKTDGKCTEAVFMHKKEYIRYAYVNALEAHAVEIPYKNTRFSMVIVKPRGRVEELTRDLPHEQLHRVLAAMQPTDLLLQIPRFTAQFEHDLVSPLESLQVKEIFGPKSDLSTILENKNETLMVSNVLHAAKVVVNEEGSEAAAVTGAILVPLMRPLVEQKTFIADKPFLFFIRDSLTNAVLFAGRISDPEEAPPESSEEAEEEDETPPPAEDSNLVGSANKNIEEEPAEPNPLSIRKPGRPPPVPSFVGRPSGFLSTKVYPEHVPSSINFEDYLNNPKDGPKKPSTVSEEPHDSSAASSTKQSPTTEKVSEGVTKDFGTVTKDTHGTALPSLTTTPPPLLRKPPKKVEKPSAPGHNFKTTSPPPLKRKPSTDKTTQTTPSLTTTEISINELPSKSSTTLPSNPPHFSFESPSQKKTVLRTLFVEHLIARDDLPWAFYNHNLFIHFSDRSKRRRSPDAEKITFQP